MTITQKLNAEIARLRDELSREKERADMAERQRDEAIKALERTRGNTKGRNK